MPTWVRNSTAIARRASNAWASRSAFASVFTAVRGRSVPEWAAEFDAVSWPQFFLKFLLGNEAVTAVIPGTTNPAHMADNLGAGRGRFPDNTQRQAMVKFFETL